MSNKIHPAVNDLKSDMEKGKMSRREFIRMSTLLGVSAYTATQMAGLAWPLKAFAGNIKRGGTLKVGTTLQKITHPATLSWQASIHRLPLDPYVPLSPLPHTGHPPWVPLSTDVPPPR